MIITRRKKSPRIRTLKYYNVYSVIPWYDCSRFILFERSSLYIGRARRIYGRRGPPPYKRRRAPLPRRASHVCDYYYFRSSCTSAYNKIYHVILLHILRNYIKYSRYYYYYLFYVTFRTSHCISSCVVSCFVGRGPIYSTRYL